MDYILTWRSKVEAETGTPLEGVVFSLLVTRNDERQLLVRPAPIRTSN
jgi:hypothetical protein